MIRPNGTDRKWTANEVRIRLPDAPVRETCGCRVGMVSGRLNGGFATVTLADGRHAEFSWDAIARALNGGNGLGF